MTSLDPPNCRRYGIPLYGVSWVPLKPVGSPDLTDAIPADTNSGSVEVSNNPNYLLLTGGGGEGRCGIPNEILLTQFNFSDESLSDNLVARLGTGDELPYRMAVHPHGEGIICSLPERCRWFDWDKSGSNENGKLCLRLSDKVLTQLEDVGQQLAITFSEDGSLLAVGGEDGKLRVFKWPSLEILLNEKPYSAVKDLHFSVDGKYLASVGTGGPCRIWDATTSKVISSLTKKNDEDFGFCRFSQRNGGVQVLYTTAVTSKGGAIISWNTQSWKRRATKQVARDPVSAFSVSVDGKFLAVGTIQGDILVLDSSLGDQMIVKKAHLGLVTALAFSSDSRALASASLDSSARVTLVKEKVKDTNGFSYSIIVFIILLAVAVYLLKSKGMIPDSLPFH